MNIPEIEINEYWVRHKDWCELKYAVPARADWFDTWTGLCRQYGANVTIKYKTYPALTIVRHSRYH